ncbi:hypothetical protein PIB30_047524 [Stylosanthes scabra]|uniref:Transmembrane protein n=1 Tax=Stylosanthes scabra TaxID=79078 RepID=A0ABU6YJ41_9FABA|nr:hypothetical protein [Stylosanthes scabra]
MHPFRPKVCMPRQHVTLVLVHLPPRALLLNEFLFHFLFFLAVPWFFFLLHSLFASKTGRGFSVISRSGNSFSFELSSLRKRISLYVSKASFN